jgi:NitT/TauT family transport system permease protein
MVRVEGLAWPAMTFIIAIALWELVCRLGLVPAYIVPAPSAIGLRLIETWPLLVEHTAVTAVEILLGFLIAVIIGILLAVAVVYIKPFEKSIYPWLVVSQAIPKVAIGPLIILWLGFGLAPKIMIAFLIAFFPVTIATVIGLRSVETESVYLLRSMGARRWKTFIYLNLPNALPSLFGGIKVAITLATVGAIVGEFIGADKGLGYVLIFANGTMDANLSFAVIVLISILAVVFYMLASVIEDFCIKWHVSKRHEFTSFTM